MLGVGGGCNWAGYCGCKPGGVDIAGFIARVLALKMGYSTLYTTISDKLQHTNLS